MFLIAAATRIFSFRLAKTETTLVSISLASKISKEMVEVDLDRGLRVAVDPTSRGRLLLEETSVLM